MGTQQFCLRWNHHQNNMMAVFEQLLSNEALVDVTLACEGLSLKAHKTILSACSPFFQSLFLENPCKHPIVILKDIKYCDLKAIVEFMYRGEVNVTQDQLSALLKIAETLQVKGLAEIANSNQQTEDTLMDTISPHQFSNIPLSEPPVQPKRTLPQSNSKRRVRNRKRSNSGSVQNENIDCGSTRIKEQPDSPEIIDDPVADILSDTSSQENTSLDISQQPVHSHCSSFDNVNREQILPVENSHLTSLQTDYCRNPKMSKGDVYDMEPYKLMEQSMTTESVPLLTQEQLSSPILNQMTASTSSHEQSIGSLQTNIPSKCQSIGSVSSTPSQPTFNNEISQGHVIYRQQQQFQQSNRYPILMEILSSSETREQLYRHKSQNVYRRNLKQKEILQKKLHFVDVSKIKLKAV
ncbi:protein abrupt-like isoform X3 [Centruroides vittatus]|uniref:protein abrupt-like isoform X3 n=1 Tax=Centruroides vittatus TaxID=120091 RepID=UPI00350F1318